MAALYSNATGLAPFLLPPSWIFMERPAFYAKTRGYLKIPDELRVATLAVRSNEVVRVNRLASLLGFSLGAPPFMFLVKGGPIPDFYASVQNTLRTVAKSTKLDQNKQDMSLTADRKYHYCEKLNKLIVCLPRHQLCRILYNVTSRAQRSVAK